MQGDGGRGASWGLRPWGCLPSCLWAACAANWVGDGAALDEWRRAELKLDPGLVHYYSTPLPSFLAPPLLPPLSAPRPPSVNAAPF